MPDDIPQTLRVYSAEWGWSVSALMPSAVEARVDGHVGKPRLRPHRRVVRMTGGAEYSHRLGVGSVAKVQTAEFSVSRVHREWWFSRPAACSHLIMPSPKITTFAPATASAAGGDRACVGVVGVVDSCGGCRLPPCRAGAARAQGGCRAGLEQLP